MRTLFAALCCVTLIACSADVDDTSESSPTQSGTPTYSEGWGPSGSGNYDCLPQTSYHHIVVDGKSYLVRVPTLCNPNPEIYKGDPGPDMGDPYDSRSNPEIREKILERFNAKFAPSGSSNFAPHN